MVNNLENVDIVPSCYYLYPRSSIYKTPLRMANETGIIDSGYRGSIMGMFDCKVGENYNNWAAKKYDRITQICAPGLIPIIVNIVDNAHELSETTSRGTGGFGSTGI
jgi:dUTP pyrophosphatase